MPVQVTQLAEYLALETHSHSHSNPKSKKQTDSQIAEGASAGSAGRRQMLAKGPDCKMMESFIVTVEGKCRLHRPPSNPEEVFSTDIYTCIILDWALFPYALAKCLT